MPLLTAKVLDTVYWPVFSPTCELEAFRPFSVSQDVLLLCNNKKWGFQVVRKEPKSGLPMTLTCFHIVKQRWQFYQVVSDVSPTIGHFSTSLGQLAPDSFPKICKTSSIFDSCCLSLLSLCCVLCVAGFSDKKKALNLLGMLPLSKAASELLN